MQMKSITRLSIVATHTTTMQVNATTTATDSTDMTGLRNRKKKMGHCFRDFCKQTILHGWHYLADSENSAIGGNGNHQQDTRCDSDSEDDYEFSGRSTPPTTSPIYSSHGSPPGHMSGGGRDPCAHKTRGCGNCCCCRQQQAASQQQQYMQQQPLLIANPEQVALLGNQNSGRTSVALVNDTSPDSAGVVSTTTRCFDNRLYDYHGHQLGHHPHNNHSRRKVSSVHSRSKKRW